VVLFSFPIRAAPRRTAPHRAAPRKCLRISAPRPSPPLVVCPLDSPSGFQLAFPTRFRFSTYGLNSGGPIKRKHAKEIARRKRREERMRACVDVREAFPVSAWDPYTYMHVHRDTIVRVALIPQLRWIQLLTLLHVCSCVSDQTREAVLHRGPGGGLASEYLPFHPPDTRPNARERERERDAHRERFRWARHSSPWDCANLAAGTAKRRPFNYGTN